MAIRRRSDNRVRYKGPTRLTDGTPILDGTGSGVLRLFNERKEHTFARFETRLRSDVNISGVNCLIPIGDPQPIEDGDTISIETSSGIDHVSVVDNIAPSGVAYEVCVLVTPLASDAPAGSKVWLETKSSGGLVLPVVTKDIPFVAGDTLEIQNDTPGSVALKTVSYTAPGMWTEDNEPAVNQPTDVSFIVLTATMSGTVSVGREIRLKIGANRTLTIYNSNDDEDIWASTDPLVASGGWEYVIPADEDLHVGQVIRLEVHFDGGTDLEDVVTWLETVTEF